MLKKKVTQQRFNTAAARIMVSSKLPRDFFLPSRQKDEQNNSLCPHRFEDAEKHPTIIINNQSDPLLFTFHRSSSEDKLKLRDQLFAPKRSLPKNKSNKLIQMKLPPVSLNIPKQNCGGYWRNETVPSRDRLKKLGRISNRILHESNVQLEQSMEVAK